MTDARNVAVCVPSPEALAAIRHRTAPGISIVVMPRADAAAATAPADLVVVAEGVSVAAGWLEALQAALGNDGTVATVDAIALDVDVPGAAHGTPGRHPRIPDPRWACTLITRAALDLAGPLDDGFVARCSERGLLHVATSDVVVARAEGVAADEANMVVRAKRRARAVADGLAVTVDARILRDPIAGTQVHTLELLAALHRTGRVRLRALVPPNPTPTAAAMLATLPDLELVDSDRLDEHTPATSIVHRPYQVTGALDLATLRQVGERLVITHQDLLTFHNPAYHADAETWNAYRRLTRVALDAAYGAVAFSRHAAADLLAEELVTSERLHVVPIGVDHRLGALAAAPREPDAARAFGDEPFLLCLGTDLRHKNRPFAIRLLDALRERHGWTGRLGLAGTHAAIGSSSTEEAALLAHRPELAERVVDLGAPDEDEKAWLYANAAAVVYPTTFEGFGLVPFEAADRGTPCLFAPQAALVETVGEYATLVPWDAAASADRVIALLREGPERAALVAGIAGVGTQLTWDAAADALVDVYLAALETEVDEASWAGLEAEAGRGHWEGMYWALRNDVGATGLALVGPDGTLPESAQRTLAALARRPATRRPLLAALRTIGRLSRMSD